VRAKIYDINRIFIIQWSNTLTVDAYPVQVHGDTMSSLFAPYCLYFNIAGFELPIATPPVIYMIAILVLIVIILINLKAFIGNWRKTNG